MKNKSYFLLIILLVLTYLTYIKPIKILKPFYDTKDLLLSLININNSDIKLSSDSLESIIDNLQEDNDELKKLSNINLSISNFEMINATIIERNREYWFNTLTINKGTNDGVEIDMAVIDSNGLIGRINSVTNHTSMVKLLTTNDTKNKVSAVIKNDNDKIYGIINGYDIANDYLLLTITDNIKINYGSKVETTGMGGVFPSGILIGKVVDMKKKEDGVTNIVRVKPSSNIEGERYVSVLSRQEISLD